MDKIFLIVQSNHSEKVDVFLRWGVSFPQKLGYILPLRTEIFTFYRQSTGKPLFELRTIKNREIIQGELPINNALTLKIKEPLRLSIVR